MEGGGGGKKAVLTKQTGFSNATSSITQKEKGDDPSYQSKTRRKEKKDARVSEYRGGVYRGRRIRDGFDENMDNPLERERGNESNSLSLLSLRIFVVFLLFFSINFELSFWLLKDALLIVDRLSSSSTQIAPSGVINAIN